MGVHIRIVNIWKTQKTFRPSQLWLHDCKKRMQIPLHVAHSQQDEARARQLLRPVAQQAGHNIPWISVSCPCFLQAEKQRCWKAVLASFFPMFIFPQKTCRTTYSWRFTWRWGRQVPPPHLRYCLLQHAPKICHLDEAVSSSCTSPSPSYLHHNVTRLPSFNVAYPQRTRTILLLF